MLHFMSRIITMVMGSNSNALWNGPIWTRSGLHGQVKGQTRLHSTEPWFKQTCFELLKIPNETLITECDYYEYKTLPGDEEAKYHQFSNMCQVWRHHHVLAPLCNGRIKVSMTGTGKVYWIIYLSLGCIIPIVLIIVSYTQIISTIRQTKENLTQDWLQTFFRKFNFRNQCCNQQKIGRANVDKQQQLSHLIRTLSLFSVSSLGLGDSTYLIVKFQSSSTGGLNGFIQRVLISSVKFVMDQW